MTPEQVQAWIQAGSVLVNTGLIAWGTIEGWIKSQHTGATEDELNAVLSGIEADAVRRRELARGDAGLPPTSNPQ